MKKTRFSKNFELSIDAVEYLFVEWLRRRGVLPAFRSNCGFDKEHNNSFRAMLRRRIQNAMLSFNPCVGHLIAMSFLFTSTPEGYAYWSELSFAWRRFCTDFQHNFK